MFIDLAGAFSSSLVSFTMGMPGGQDGGCSQNTSVLLIPVSINRVKYCMSGASSVRFYRIPTISCGMSGRTSQYIIFLVTSKHSSFSSVLVLWVLPFYRWHTASTFALITTPMSRDCGRCSRGSCWAHNSRCLPCRYYSHLEVCPRMVPRCQVPE